MIRAPVNPDVLTWARERAGYQSTQMTAKFPKFVEWETGIRRPTFKQADAVARKFHIPVGYLFLSKPPRSQELPIPDFRTVASAPLEQPSLNLLEVIDTCRKRQDWFKNHARTHEHDEIAFIRSATTDDPPDQVAALMRDKLGFGVADRQECDTWTDALSMFIRAVQDAGPLVMVSGIVGNDTHRKLEPDEFRGFALSDSLAPVIFVNGADTKAAQMFTLAHELAHLWLGESALSNCEASTLAGVRSEETWCNAVAAEFLVPLAEFRPHLTTTTDLSVMLKRLAKVFKVSTLVILRRLLDSNWMTQDEFSVEWSREVAHLKELAKSRGGGGDFFRSVQSRVDSRFARALIASTLEGETLYRDAYELLGVYKQSTFENLTEEVFK